VKNLISGIPGFIAFNLVRCESGAFSVSVYEDRTGAEESVRVAREYLQQNLPGISGPPEVIQGEAVLSVSAPN
jgi:heme-degrading monooxygenase HmoA